MSASAKLGLVVTIAMAVIAGPGASTAHAAPGAAAKIIFLHHSTGGVIWEGGVADWFGRQNATRKTRYQITAQDFPKASPYGWNNYPYDYWNIWVNNAGNAPFNDEPTLEILTKQYDVIVFKHCFPVSNIESGGGRGNVASAAKTLANYKLQYLALKKKLLQFPKTKFIVWTGAVNVRRQLNPGQAQRTKQFFDWVRSSWDEKGDNIFIWDFYQLETDGGLYLKDSNANGANDSHPSAGFARKVAPMFGQRVVDVIEGRGDTASIEGKP